jgi:hypothetical protein
VQVARIRANRIKRMVFSQFFIKWIVNRDRSNKEGIPAKITAIQANISKIILFLSAVL